MALSRSDRSDYLDAARPPFGKRQVKYPTPNLADLTVIEQLPISPESYEPLPYHSPHPDFETNGLILVWQGPVKAVNNQISVLRVYSNDLAANADWYNAALHYSADVVEAPIYLRSYIELREDYAPLPKAAPLVGIIRLIVTNGGSGYEETSTVAFTGGGGTGGMANIILAADKVIALELTAEGDYTSTPAAVFSGPGTGAVVEVEVQPGDAVLVKEETSKLESADPQLASLFIQVHRVYETLPGPWVPFTRYDERLGPIQGRRRAVLNSDQRASISATFKRTYEGREGSAIVSSEIEENWTTGTGIDPNPPFPIYISDTYTDERGAVDRSEQVVVAAGDEELQEATFTRFNGVVTRTQYHEFPGNDFLLIKIVENWVEVRADDRIVTSEFGGGILARTETTDEPGAQQVETGFLVVSSRLSKKSPNEQTLITEKLSPESAEPSLELLDGGVGYSAAPGVSFSGGVGTETAAATAVLGFGVQSVTTTATGGDYETPPSVRFVGAIGGGAFAVAVLGFPVTGVTIDDGGEGYSIAPDLTINGDGTLAAGTVILGFGVNTPLVTTGGSGFTEAPTVKISGPLNGGRQPQAHAVLFGGSVAYVVLDDPGEGYEAGETPTVTFLGDGSGATATVALLTVGKVKRVAMTSSGTAYSYATAVFSGGGGGSGVLGTPQLGLAGKLKRVEVITPGVFRSTPDVEFVPAGSGSGAAGTAVLSTTNGSVVELILTVPGLYTEAPTVVFAPSGASAIYNIGSAFWPELRGFHVDETTGIKVDIFKKTVPAGTPYPGRSGYRGPFIEMSPHDRWKSIQIVSKVDLNTLPAPEAWNTTHPFNLPPTLLSIEAVWSDVVSKLTNAQKTSANVSVSSGSSGGVIVRSSAGYRGYAQAVIARDYFFGSPLVSAIPKPFKIIPSSGSVILTQKHSQTTYSKGDDGGTGFSDRFEQQVHAHDVRDHLVGVFDIINPTHLSPPQSAVAVSGGGSTAAAAAAGTLSIMTVKIPQSTPARILSGQVLLVECQPNEGRFGIWTVERIYVTVP